MLGNLLLYLWPASKQQPRLSFWIHIIGYLLPEHAVIVSLNLIRTRRGGTLLCKNIRVLLVTMWIFFLEASYFQQKLVLDKLLNQLKSWEFLKLCHDLKLAKIFQNLQKMWNKSKECHCLEGSVCCLKECLSLYPFLNLVYKDFVSIKTGMGRGALIFLGKAFEPKNSAPSLASRLILFQDREKEWEGILIVTSQGSLF